MVLLSLFVFSTGCDSKPPKILQTDWMLQYVNDLEHGTIQEEISLYLLLEDPDSQDDVAEIALIRDDDEVYWLEDSRSWISKKSGTGNWIGYNRILPEEQIFPSGSYRLLITDRSSSTTESQIYLPENRLKLEDIEFPDVEIIGNQISIQGNYPQYLIWVYNDDDELILSSYQRNGIFNLQNLLGGPAPFEAASYLWVFSFIESRYAGVKTGPYPLHPEIELPAEPLPSELSAPAE